ncbi:FAD-dependent oxidoreductase (plasmid) [Paraburkholderia acidicola]|uniref:FAD-dependent oxidoreductase n=1 Tax=Paraburkholderia acidicola TaxID=1912599 RepID=A0ABV1LYK0_9BURK
MSDSSPMQTIARLTDLHEGVPTRVNVDKTPVLLIRRGSEVRAFGADCPHAGAPLEKGALCRGKLVCPWHKGTFDADSGALLEPPALQGLTRYAISLDGDEVRIRLAAGDPTPAGSVGATGSRAGDTLAIVGGGAAGASACASLREFGFAGRLVLVDAETDKPYDRTALSKFVPAGELSTDDVYPLLPEGFFDQHHVERIRGAVTMLDSKKRTIAIDGAQTLSYDTALLAPGSVPKIPQIRGLGEPPVDARVVFLRNLGDARRLDWLAAAGGRAVVIGSSSIGLEVAAALRKRKLRVTVVSPDPIPFATQFGDAIGAHFRALHERNGTTLRMRAKVTAIKPDDPLHVQFDDGSVLGCDFVVIGAGVRPATDRISGVKWNEDGGIDVDASMRVTDALYAAGDIAAFQLTPDSRRIRIEHWRVAQQQGRIAARAMLGLGSDSDHSARLVPFFWTFHYGKRFDYLGHARAGDWDEAMTTGSLDDDDFITLFVRNGTVQAVLACNRERASARLAEALHDPLTVDAARRLIDD